MTKLLLFLLLAILSSSSLLVAIVFAQKNNTAPASIIVEGDSYVQQQQSGNCHHDKSQTLAADLCYACTNVIDCAIECSQLTSTPNNNNNNNNNNNALDCIGFILLNNTNSTNSSNDSSTAAICTLLSAITCDGDDKASIDIYYKRIRQAAKPEPDDDESAAGQQQRVKKLSPRRQGGGDNQQPSSSSSSSSVLLDALNPEYCGDGSLRYLYDPFEVKPRIVGGREAERGEFPFQALIPMVFHDAEIGFPKASLCGGALIDREWVLSAAHCFYPEVLQSDSKTVNMSLGRLHYRKSDDTEQGGVQSRLLIRNKDHSNIFIHPKFNPNVSFDYDFSLLRLNPPLKKYTKFVSPICLTNKPVPDFTNKVVVTTGWGRLDEGAEAAFLRRKRRSAEPNSNINTDETETADNEETNNNEDDTTTAAAATTMMEEEEEEGDSTTTESTMTTQQNEAPNLFDSSSLFANWIKPELLLMGHPDVLRKLPRRLLPADDCVEGLKPINASGSFNARTMVCSSISGHRDQCQGDSGGPWATVAQPFGKMEGSRWTLVALTSWGEGCGRAVGIGAKITDEVLDWVLKTVADANNNKNKNEQQQQ